MEVESILNGESGFKKLEGCGGYELLHCGSNCRTLSKVDVRWDVKSLKTVIGGQSRIYIRPIQTSLQLEYEDDEVNTSDIKFPCKQCGVEFNVSDLREHTNMCTKTDINLVTDEVLFYNEAVLEQPFEVNMPLDLNGAILFSSDLQVEIPAENTNLSNSLVEKQSSEIEKISECCIEDIKAQEITDPIHALRYLQSKIVTGRKLDLEVEDLVAGIGGGQTNFIIVDRQHILSTGMDEIKELKDVRPTLEVQFYGEVNQI